MKKAILVLLAVLVIPFAVQAADQSVQFKAGDISVALLNSDGVTPMKATSIKMLSPADQSVLQETVSDSLGNAVLALAEGRYLLNVSDVTLAVMDVSPDATITSCRVVMPAAAMLVAGAEEVAEEEGVAGEAVSTPAWVVPAGIGVGAAAVLVGTGFIIDNQQPKGHHGSSPSAI